MRRQKNTEFTDEYLQLEENSVTYRGENNIVNDFTGTLSKFVTMEKDLNYEGQRKIHNYFSALYAADINHVPRAKCFDNCIVDIRALNLSSMEKNCMRECYMKRFTSRHDFQHLMLEKLALVQQEAHDHQSF